MKETANSPRKSEWTFMTNYSHVLLCLANDSSMRARQIAAEVGITERAVLSILKDLVEGGYVTVIKQGRCNSYSIDYNKPLKHPIEKHCSIGMILELLKK